MKLKKNLLLWNYWANLNQTLLKWFLGGPLPKLCLSFQTSDQDGHHSRTLFNTGPIATKLWWNDPWICFQNCVRWSRLPTKMATKLKIEKRGDEILKKSSPRKLLSQSQPNCWNDPWVVPFQNCVRHFRPPTKMATTAKLNLT